MLIYLHHFNMLNIYEPIYIRFARVDIRKYAKLSRRPEMLAVKIVYTAFC